MPAICTPSDICTTALTVVAVLAAVTLAVAAGLWALRRGLTPPRLTDAPVLAPGDPCPQAVRLAAVRGRSLHALWLPPLAGATTSAGVVLMHGWGGNGATLWPAARALHAAGFAVLLPDARSHGHSDADTFSSLPRFAEDTASALHWLSGQPGVDARRLALLGHSVGAAAALLCASGRLLASTPAKRPADPPPVLPTLAAVVSVSAFAHPEQVMRRWLASRRIPYWPLGWAVNRYVEHVIGHRFNRIAPTATLPHIACPVLLVHGQQDDVVPPDCARQLQRCNPRTELWLVPGQHDRFDDETTLQATVTRWLHNHTAA